MNSIPLAKLRKDYSLKGLRRKNLAPNPIAQFNRWFQEAWKANVPEAHAMTLATANKKGRPSSRTVLLRNADQRGFVFFTNYRSQKGNDLAKNPWAAITFHWPKLERQVCIAGKISKVSRKESEIYFHSRPRGSQLAAWVSQQSNVIANRNILDDGLLKMTEKYRGEKVPLPSYWGGFLLSPVTIEFWQGRPNRLHDRFRYSKKSNSKWTIDRLAP